MIRKLVPLLLLALTALSCRTVGVSKTGGGFAEVNPSIAHVIILDNRHITVLDFRSSAEYEAGHIAGAVSTPLETIEHRLPELLPYQRTTVLVYGNEDDSRRGARLLIAAGFRNVVRINGGMDGWIRGGYPTVSSQ